MMVRIWTIIKKDLLLDFREKQGIAAVFLFVVACVFIVFRAFNEFSGFEWNALLWIIVVFTGINAVLKSFSQESKHVFNYYYTLHDPVELIIAKLIYNVVLLGVLFIAVVFLMTFFGSNQIHDWTLFILSSSLGVIGIAIVYTLIASLANTSGQNSTLMSILAMPLIIPILLTLIQTTSVSMRLMQKSDINTDLIILGGIDGLLLGVSLLLFPLAWKT